MAISLRNPHDEDWRVIYITYDLRNDICFASHML